MIPLNKPRCYFSVILLIFISLVLENSLLASESKLTLSKEFHLIAINGKGHPSAQRQPHIVPLKQGINKIALQYRAILNKQTSNAISTVTSKMFIVSFHLKNKDRFRLTFLKPATYLAMLQFSKSPKINFINVKKTPLDLNISIPLNQRIENIINLTKAIPGLRRSQSPINITSKKQK
ncbi:MAG: hypothetical protein COA86_15915 [Kangiella sp.]|nr:MAG: hypothetical protein COA86_15915 [Kangiella sp.]